MSIDVVAVGDLMLDVHARADALVAGGDVHGRVLVQPAGTSANVAVWAATTQAATAVVGRIGADVPGRMIGEALAARGVAIDGVVVDEDAATGTMLVLHRPGDRDMVADRGANARLGPDDLPPAIEAGAVLVSGYLLLQEPTVETGIEALARARTPLLGVEAASWPLLRAFGVERFFEAAGPADAVFANDLEAQVLVGVDGREACGRLGERFRVAAVKCGETGAWLSIDGDLLHASSPSVEEIDPTGAGDAFDGVLLAGLARGIEPAEALEAACRAGASVAASESTWPAPTEVPA
jgi:ribokinase